jgi:acyl dehydratase
MSKRIIKSVEDFLNLSGELLGTSEWLSINQEVINHFADSTFDNQWIHVDADRAKTDSPYQTTIAHGYLTLSLIPHFLDEIFEVENLKQLVNYSVEKMVFHSVVPVNSNLRMKATLKSAKDLGDICKASIQCSFEVEGKMEPVLEGSIVFLYYFK